MDEYDRLKVGIREWALDKALTLAKEASISPVPLEDLLKLVVAPIESYVSAGIFANFTEQPTKETN